MDVTKSKLAINFQVIKNSCQKWVLLKNPFVSINPFVPSAPFLYPLKMSEKRKGANG